MMVRNSVTLDCYHIPLYNWLSLDDAPASLISQKKIKGKGLQYHTAVENSNDQDLINITEGDLDEACKSQFRTITQRGTYFSVRQGHSQASSQEEEKGQSGPKAALQQDISFT